MPPKLKERSQKKYKSENREQPWHCLMLSSSIVVLKMRNMALFQHCTHLRVDRGKESSTAVRGQGGRVRAGEGEARREARQRKRKLWSGRKFPKLQKYYGIDTEFWVELSNTSG